MLTIDHPRQRVRPWAARHPYAAVNALVVTAGWAAASAPILASRGVIPGGSLVDRLPTDLEKTAALAVMAVLVPAGFWIARQADGRGRTDLLVRRMAHRRIGAGRWFLALAALPVTTVLLGTALGRSPDLSPGGLAEQLVALAVAVAVINLWEEALWAGTVQSRLEVRHRLPAAAFLTAVPFALVHIPLRFVEDDFGPAAAAGQFVALLLLGTVVRLLIGVVLRAVDGSLLAVGVFHAAFNSSNNEQGIGATVLGPDHQGFALLAVLVLLGWTLVSQRGRLGRRDPHQEVVS